MRFVLFPLFCLLSFSPSALHAQSVALFNGHDLEGWHPFLAIDGVIPADAFTVTDDGFLRIEGKCKGYLRTKEVFSNYRLIVEWRWVDQPGNSGVLLHAQGVDQIWPLCVEAQLKTSRAGDLILMGVGCGGTFGTETVVVTHPEHPNYAAKRLSESSEHAPGEWNQYEIIAAGTSLKISVNGVLQNQATELTLSAGSICLQSEGVPIEFRTVRIEPLD